MINIAEKMERKSRLQSNLSRWMIQHGTVLSDRSRSNEYVGVRIMEVRWRNENWRITEVDGMTCRIERI